MEFCLLWAPRFSRQLKDTFSVLTNKIYQATQFGELENISEPIPTEKSLQVASA